MPQRYTMFDPRDDTQPYKRDLDEAERDHWIEEGWVVADMIGNAASAAPAAIGIEE